MGLQEEQETANKLATQLVADLLDCSCTIPFWGEDDEKRYYCGEGCEETDLSAAVRWGAEAVDTVIEALAYKIGGPYVELLYEAIKVLWDLITAGHRERSRKEAIAQAWDATQRSIWKATRQLTVEAFAQSPIASRAINVIRENYRSGMDGTYQVGNDVSGIRVLRSDAEVDEYMDMIYSVWPISIEKTLTRQRMRLWPDLQAVGSTIVPRAIKNQCYEYNEEACTARNVGTGAVLLCCTLEWVEQMWANLIRTGAAAAAPPLASNAMREFFPFLLGTGFLPRNWAEGLEGRELHYVTGSPEAWTPAEAYREAAQYTVAIEHAEGIAFMEAQRMRAFEAASGQTRHTRYLSLCEDARGRRLAGGPTVCGPSPANRGYALRVLRYVPAALRAAATAIRSHDEWDEERVQDAAWRSALGQCVREESPGRRGGNYCSNSHPNPLSPGIWRDIAVPAISALFNEMRNGIPVFVQKDPAAAGTPPLDAFDAAFGRQSIMQRMGAARMTGIKVIEEATRPTTGGGGGGILLLGAAAALMMMKGK